MRTLFLLSLAAVLAWSRPIPAAPERDEQAERDERLLRNAGVRTDGAGLLAFFRQHTTTEADLASIQRLVRELGADRYQTRETASARLAALGERAAPFLKKAAAGRDPEVVSRARACLQEVQAGSAEAVLSAAARMVARRKPEGAAQVLLDYLPFAGQEFLAREVREALAAVTIRGGKPEPVVVAALADRSPARRAAAGVALARTRSADVLPAVRKLLADRDPSVRRLVGLTLVAARDKEALPVLIALLEELPPGETGEIENILYTLAGEKAPDASPGTTAAERKQYRTAWEGWYREHQKGLDLAKLEEAAKPRGHTLVVLLDAGRVIELDAANKPVFAIDGLKFPLDAQYLPGDRVLVAEYEGGRVSERNRKGEVVWEKKVLNPLVAQRLPNGHTFIATSNRFVEVDRAGKEVWSQAPPLGGRVMKAVRLRNGHVACVTLLGVPRFYEVNREGEVLRNFGVQLSTSGGRIDVLRNGHVIVPEKDANRVVEFNAQGRRVWEVPFEQPVAAVRLPNGHTLVTSFQAQRAVEVDRKGKEVWQYRTATRVTRALRH